MAPMPTAPGQPVPVKAGQPVEFDASGSTDPGSNPLTFRWDFNDGTSATGPRVTHAFTKLGLHGAGLTVNNGRFSDLAYRDFIVYEDVQEFGTEGQAGQWDWTEVLPREGLHVSNRKVIELPPAVPVANPTTKLTFSDDPQICLVGKSSLALQVQPSGNPISLLYPKTKDAGIPLAGKTELVFWVKMLNLNVHAWKGLMPTVTLYESPTKFASCALTTTARTGRAASTGSTRPCRCTAARCGISRARCPARSIG